MDATAAVVLSGAVAEFGSSSLTRVDDIIPPGVVADTECVGGNPDTIESRRAARVNSGNSTRQNGSSLPAIVVEAKCTSKKIVATGVRVRKPRGGKVRAAAAAAVCADGIAEFGLNSSTQLGDSISPGMVVDAGCAGNTTGRITTPTFTAIVAPLLSRPTSRSLKRPRKDTTQLEKGWKASSDYQWVVDMKTQFKLDDVISDSLLWVSHENYIKQFDISRVGDAICKACKGVQPMQDTMLDTFCTAVGRNYPGHRNAPLSGLSVSPALSETGATAADILCHLDSATPQTQLVSYGTGHFWCVWTQDPIVDDSGRAAVLPWRCEGWAGVRWWPLTRHLASAAEYVEGRRSIDEQDAAHMSPELSQQPRYAGSICHLGCGRLPEVSNCVAAALRHCPRRWATATSCLVVQEGRHRALFLFQFPLISNTLPAPAPAPSAAAAAPPLPASPSLLPVLISATVATPAVGSGPARLNNKRAAAEFTDSDTIIAAAPKRLCKS
ncbi:hypothetical protein BASA83_009781 [Batrachochytrium salamandrivorans]|nr:hypothetical protein BASA83_009781 [Batrachochytrium salamandrivorans]